MKIIELYSHLNGREHIHMHKPHLWQELEDVIHAVDAAMCRTKVSNEQRSLGSMLYSPIDLNKAFALQLHHRGWHESRTYYWVTDDQQLIRQGRGVPSVPLVLIGVAP